jgi:hypothetical protein
MGVMIPERSSSSVPHYCPHRDCGWSFCGTQKKAEGYLAIHLRVVHKDATPPKVEPPARPQPKLAPMVGGEESATRMGPADATSSPPTTDPTPCKTDGCPNLANDKYDRGVYHGLCEEACIPARRDAFSASIRDGKAEKQRQRAPRVEPDVAPSTSREPAPTSAIAPHAGDQPGAPEDTALAPDATPQGSERPAISALIQQAARARREHLEAERRYLEQLRLLRQHPDYERLAPVIVDAAEHA